MSMNDVHAPDRLRCPSCGGLNAPDAEWCGQCLKRFQAPEPPPPPAPEPAAPEPPRPAAPAGLQPGVERGGSGSAEGGIHGSFRSTDEGILWRCSSCDTENPLEDPVCAVCGKAFADSMRPPPPARAQRDPGMTAMISLFFPGAGHAYLGMWPHAIARAVVSVWVGLMAFFFGIGGNGGSAAVAVLYGLIAFALWMVAAHDSYQEASAEPGRVLLHGRRFTYLVLGLLMLLLASLFLTAMTNR
jgi:hypothetical protein